MKQDVNDTCAAVAALFFPNSPENLLSSTNLTALLSSQYSSGCRQQGRFKGKKWVMGTHSSIFRNGGAIFICLVKQWENFAEKLYAGHWHCQQYTYLQKLKTENWSNKNACVWFWILMCSYVKFIAVNPNKESEENRNEDSWNLSLSFFSSTLYEFLTGQFTDIPSCNGNMDKKGDLRMGWYA